MAQRRLLLWTLVLGVLQHMHLHLRARVHVLMFVHARARTGSPHALWLGFRLTCQCVMEHRTKGVDTRLTHAHTARAGATRWPTPTTPSTGSGSRWCSKVGAQTHVR